MFGEARAVVELWLCHNYETDLFEEGSGEVLEVGGIGEGGNKGLKIGKKDGDTGFEGVGGVEVVEGVGTEVRGDIQKGLCVFEVEVGEDSEVEFWGKGGEH